MASDQAAKKAALETRLKALDADTARVVQKRKDTEAQLANLARKGEAAAAKPAKAEKAAKGGKRATAA